MSDYKKTNKLLIKATTTRDDVVYCTDTKSAGLLIYTCVVCGKPQWAGENCQSGIHSDHLVRLGDYYYIIMDYREHESCRSLFRVNPLAYE